MPVVVQVFSPIVTKGDEHWEAQQKTNDSVQRLELECLVVKTLVLKFETMCEHDTD